MKSARAPVALAIALVSELLALPAARAQTTTIPKPEIFQVSRKVANSDGSFSYLPFDIDSAQKFFNLANCRCQSVFTLELQYQSILSLPSDTVEIWTGSNCDQATDPTRNQRCTRVGTFPLQELNAGQRKRFDVPVNRLMFPVGTCDQMITGTSTVWALIDEGANGSYEGDWKIDPALTYDAQPPPPVLSPSSSGVEDAVLVSWTKPSVISDIRSYQILCAYEDGTPVTTSPPNADYLRWQDICPGSGPPPVDVPDAGVGTPDAGMPDAGASGVFAGFNALSPAYVCSATATGSVDSLRVDIPQTGAVRPVLTQVVSIDPYRNPTVVSVPGTATPAPVTDAWETYKDDGGQADGGFCFVATAAYGNYDHPYVRVLRHFRDHTLAHTGWGRAFIAWYYAHSPPWAAWLRRHPVARVAAAVALFPVVVFAWVWDVTALVVKLLALAAAVAVVVWRRRRRARGAAGRRLPRLAAAAIGVLALLAGAGAASAQVHVEDDTLADPEVRGPPLSQWAFEIRLGPYFPAVDSESALGGRTPYQDVFGDGNSLMTGFELDRFFLYPGGELGVALAVSYMSETNFAFTQDASGNPTTMRSMDETSFHLLPLSLLAVYRFTLLAERTVVPLVPYGKLGFTYGIWWFDKGNGDTASWNGMAEGKGGTLGWQGTLGLQFRADRLDPDGARNLENDLGVEHISFFGEVVYASIDGLLQSNRLHVGDLTWSVGLNFEF